MIVPNLARFIITDSRSIRTIEEVLIIFFIIMTVIELLFGRYILASVFAALIFGNLSVIGIIDKCHKEKTNEVNAIHWRNK
jgi:hypothetical protein